MKSTKTAPPRLEDPAAITPDKRDLQIAALQDDLAECKDARLEERYWWGMVSAFFFDCFLLSHVSFWGFLLLFLVQFIPLIYFARRLGVDYAAIMLDRIWEIISRKLR